MSEMRPRIEAFAFGDPTPVLDGREVLEYMEAWRNGKWYEPPVSLEGLARSFRATPHHSSAIYVKRNILVSSFKPHRLLMPRGVCALRARLSGVWQQLSGSPQEPIR